MKLTLALFKGWGENQYGSPRGVWLTGEQIKAVVENRYNPDLQDKPMRLGGKWIIPRDFLGEGESRELRDLAESSTTADKGLFESLLDAGYVEEVQEACIGTGWDKFVTKAIANQGYKGLKSGSKSLDEVNVEGLKKLEALKRAKLKSKNI